MSTTTSSQRRFVLTRDDKPIAIAALFIVVILIAGSIYTLARYGTMPLLTPTYLIQQLQIGSYLKLLPPV